MAFTASSSSAAQAFSSHSVFLLPPSEKLVRSNHGLWRAQVLSALRGAQLADLIEPTAAPPDLWLPPVEKPDPKPGEKKEPPVKNPEHTIWIAKDQTVLSYLLSNLGREILSQVSTKITAATAWAAIEEMFASQSRARIITTRMALATASKGASTMSEYFTKMKGLADDMASAGRKLEDDELISYILTGLDLDFDPIVTSVTARVEPITMGELYAQLVSYEQRHEMKGGSAGQQSSANMAAKGGRFNNSNNNSRNGSGRSGGRGGFTRGGKSGRGGGRSQKSSFVEGLFCQVCGKEGHPAWRCFKRNDGLSLGLFRLLNRSCGLAKATYDAMVRTTVALSLGLFRLLNRPV